MPSSKRAMTAKGRIQIRPCTEIIRQEFQNLATQAIE